MRSCECGTLAHKNTQSPCVVALTRTRLTSTRLTRPTFSYYRPTSRGHRTRRLCRAPRCLLTFPDHLTTCLQPERSLCRHVTCFPPTHNREPYDTLLYCPTSCPYRSVCGTDAACSSNTIRDSISRVAPSQRGPRSAPALRHARRPCALTRGRPTVPRRPGTGRSRRTARRAALAPAVLR